MENHEVEIIKSMMSAINEIIKENWDKKNDKHGRVIDINPKWKSVVPNVIKRYRASGWQVNKKVEISSDYPGNCREYLHFFNPHFVEDTMLRGN